MDLTLYFFYLIDKCATNPPFNRKPQSLCTKIPEGDLNPHGVSYIVSLSSFFPSLFRRIVFLLGSVQLPHSRSAIADSSSPVLVLTVQKQIPCFLPMTKL